MIALIGALPYIQIILAVLIVAAVLMQKSESGVGGAFGGGDSWNSAYHTRRGFEKFLFNATITLAILFALVSLVALIIK
ncbi:MAG: preprotein translocase subunit SecG [Candidatus Paceibacterota bacterium]|jgi:protein translocase SecG subunit